MTPSPARHLHVIDAETGEQLSGCPACERMTVELELTTKKLRGAWLENERLKKDFEQEHLAHADRPLVESLHAEWQLVTGRRALLDFGKNSRFEAWLRGLALAKRVKGELGLPKEMTAEALVRRAIAGAAFDPYTQQLKNGKVERYDDPTTMFKNAASFARFVKRAPA